jgi:hypothetical protein
MITGTAFLYGKVVSSHGLNLQSTSSQPAAVAAAAAAAATGTTLKCSGLSEADKKNGVFANCVDSEASAAAVLKRVGGGAAAAKAPTYVKADGKDIKAKDVACAGKAFCEVRHATAPCVYTTWVCIVLLLVEMAAGHCPALMS